MLLSLNDDCLLYICEFLTLPEQLSLAQTSQQLRTLLKENWKNKYKNVNLDSEQCIRFESQRNNFIKFMTCICENVEKLQLQNIPSKTFCFLENLAFPKTRNLLVNLSYSGEHCHDRDTVVILKAFPNLRSLTLCGSTTTGTNLWNLEHLNDLELGACEHLDTKYFKKIFTTLRLRRLSIMYHGYYTAFDELVADIAECKTLEEICIDDHHLLLLIDELPKLKKLRKLLFHTRDYDRYLLEKIVKQFGNSLHTIIFDDVFWSHDEHCQSVKSMRNLRRFLLHDDDIESEQLKVIGRSLGNTLREFRFVNGRHSANIKEGLIEFVSHCKNLEIFDISESKIVDVNFLRKVIDKFNVDLKNRRTPLIFRCFDTNVTAEDAELLTIPNCFEVSLTKEDVQFPGTRCMQCEWNLTEEEMFA